MFFIVNRKKEVVFISDLNIKLGPRQAIDLDSHMERDYSNASKDLLKLISLGSIEVKRKDMAEKPIPLRPMAMKSSNDLDINKIKNEILQEVKKGVSDAVRSSQNLNGMDPSDLAKMIAGLINQGGHSFNAVSGISKDEDILMDPTKLADIHSKAVSKKMKEIKSGSIEYIVEDANNTIDSNIAELEDLL